MVLNQWAEITRPRVQSVQKPANCARKPTPTGHYRCWGEVAVSTLLPHIRWKLLSWRELLQLDSAPIIQPPLFWDKSNRTQRNASLTQNWTHNTDARAVCRGWGHAQRPRWCSYRSNCTKFKIRPGPVLRSNKNRRKIQIAKIAALKSTARRVREMGCKAKFSPSSRNI